MKSVEELDVFKLAHQLALEIYRVTGNFPKEETFSLVTQMRRAAASVGMNLMEGAARLGTKEYRQFVGVARGSAGEVCYQLFLAKDLGYISSEVYGDLRPRYDRVLQMLSRLSQTLNHEMRTRARFTNTFHDLPRLDFEERSALFYAEITSAGSPIRSHL